MVHQPAALTRLFVYGTLLPGDLRWSFLEPFVTDDGIVDAAAGDLFATDHDYPAAIFKGDQRYNGGTIVGRTFILEPGSTQHALKALDEVEATVSGLYRRLEIVTANGVTAWAYSYGDGLILTPIPSGDWAAYRPLSSKPRRFGLGPS